MNKRIKTGGRSKGTPNRNTNEIREYFKTLINNNLEQINKDIETLEPKERIKTILELSKFVIPTLKTTEIITEPERNAQPPIQFIDVIHDSN
jgi:hypothetical protein